MNGLQTLVSNKHLNPNHVTGMGQATCSSNISCPPNTRLLNSYNQTAGAAAGADGAAEEAAGAAGAGAAGVPPGAAACAGAGTKLFDILIHDSININKETYAAVPMVILPAIPPAIVGLSTLLVVPCAALTKSTTC